MRWLGVAAVLLLVLLWVRGPRGQGRRAAQPGASAEGHAPAPVPESPPSVEPEPEEEAAEDGIEPLTLRVVDEEGAPVPGARIEVRRSENLPARATVVADGAGIATVGLESADMLFVGARGFMRAAVRGALGRQLEQVALRRAYEIAGMVVDPRGVGIAGAALTLGEPALPERTASSGPDGRFAFADVCDEEMSLRAGADGFLVDMRTVPPGDLDIRIVLWRPVSVTGLVVFPDGSPGAGASVNRGIAAPDGRFALDSIAPGRVGLWASLRRPDASWVADAAVDVAEDGTHAPVRLVLSPEPRSFVRVLVLERDGSPVAGVLVKSPRLDPPYPRTDVSGQATCVFAEEEGARTFLDVGEFKRDDGLLPGRADVVTGARDGPEVILRPREPLLLTVVVRRLDGAPLPPDLRATFWSDDPIVREDRDAVVLAVDPASSTAAIDVRVPGFSGGTRLVEASATGRAEIRLARTGSLRCRLVDEAHAAASRGFVSACVRGTDSDSSGKADPDGVHRIATIPEGRAIVTASLDGDMPLVRMEADVRGGEETDLGTIVLASPRTLRGKVTAAGGRPVGGARVTARQPGFEAQVFSRSDGSFQIVLPAWFRGRVLAEKTGHGAAHESAEQPLDLVMPPEGKVRLDVRLPPHRSGARVWSLAARDPATGFQWHVRNKERIEGTAYLVGGLPPGPLILVVETLPKNGEAPVSVVAGATVQAVVHVPE